jgi:hypothetical protein
MIPVQTRAIAIVGSLAILALIIELVRRRRLKEEYSALWVLTAIVLLVLSVAPTLLVRVTRLIGAVLPSSTLFFFGLIFVMLMLLHFSVRVSLLERRVTSLVQEVAILATDRTGGEAGNPVGPPRRDREIDGTDERQSTPHESHL